MRITTLVALLLAGCHQAPVGQARATRPASASATVPSHAAAGVALPAFTSAQLAALDTYAAFSSDGLAFAGTEESPGAGVPVLTFYAAPTGTIEKRLVLASDDSRRQAAADLLADGFPGPGTKTHLPPGMQAEVRDHSFVVTMVGRPVTKPQPAFPESPALAPSDARLLAVSSDGRYAAVRVRSKSKVGEFGRATDVRLVRLFK